MTIAGLAMASPQPEGISTLGISNVSVELSHHAQWQREYKKRNT
jgi:hypothetical protein